MQVSGNVAIELPHQDPGALDLYEITRIQQFANHPIADRVCFLGWKAAAD